MSHIFVKPLAAAAILLSASAVAHANVLVAADNGASTVYTSQVNQLFALDGSNTALSFTTTKKNEVVQLSFAAARCGIEQTAAGSAYVLNESAVQGFFYIDGAIVTTPSGNANTLCYYNVFPQAADMIQLGAAQMQQSVTIATPGKHSVSVLFQVIATNDGTQIWPVFGQSHVSVSQ